MSLAPSDLLTDEELQYLVEDRSSLSSCTSNREKKSKKNKSLCKPPPSPKSPYLSSANLHPRRAGTWHKAASELEANTPEYLKQALGMRKPKHCRSDTNGYTPGTPDYKEREDMYDEIIELKKTLQTHKSENDVLRTRLRRLQEDNHKKEKQIEQLLNPIKSSDYTRTLADKKNDSSTVINGLKQKIFKLEQQCKEKDNALMKLQSDIKTTNMEEMKIVAETYYDEIERLKLLLAAAESARKSHTAEGREWQKQQKVLNAKVLKLTHSLKELQEENRAGNNSAAGYTEWSKARLLKHIIQLEKRNAHLCLDESSRTSRSADSQRECARLQGLLTDLQDSLKQSMAEIQQLTADKQKVLQEVEGLKAEQHVRAEMLELKEKIQHLQMKLEEARELPPESLQHNNQCRQCRCGQSNSAELENKAAETIQRCWYHHRRRMRPDNTQQQLVLHRSNSGDSEQDIVLIQSALRGHLQRQTPLTKRNSPEEALKKKASPHVKAEEHVTLLQAVMRGHLSRRRIEEDSDDGEKSERSGPASVRSFTQQHNLSSTDGAVTAQRDEEEEMEEDVPEAGENLSLSGRRKQIPEQISLCPGMDSDDSDDIIVSPSRPHRRGEYFTD